MPGLRKYLGPSVELTFSPSADVFSKPTNTHHSQQYPWIMVIWKTRTRTRGHGHGHADMENADNENADMENADKHIKNPCMVDGLPCNRFGLPEKFHVSFCLAKIALKLIHTVTI